MDPVTALSLAANVIQVVEAGLKVVAQLQEIRERGSLSTNDEVDAWAEQVSEDNKNLSTALNKQTVSSNALERKIHNLCQQTKATSDELKCLMNSIKFRKRQAGVRESALKQVWRTYIKRGQIDRLGTQLKDHEAALDRGILRELYISCGEARALTDQSFAALTVGQQKIIREIIDNQGRMLQRTTVAIKTSEDNVNRQTLESHKQTVTEVRNAIGESQKHINQQTAKSQEQSILATRDAIKQAGDQVNRQTVDSATQLQAQMQHLHVNDADMRRISHLLDSLHFDNMNQRQNYIQQRVGDYGSTYHWIFEPGQVHRFNEWLASDGSLFWISGKPGSGKSSLVDYIFQELQPKGDGWSILQHWAKPVPLQVVAFFFYRPSTDPMQKSFHGLWQSLCFQLLNDDRSVARDILQDKDLPKALQRHFAHGMDSRFSWLTRDLKALFLYLVSKSQRRIFLLLDGLDEFDEDHVALFEAVKTLSAIDNLKVCCSSRPDEPFRSGFANAEKLKLQDLTCTSISDVVSRRLEGTPATSLVNLIVSKAEGVFLWARLVTEDIYRGHLDGDGTDELKARVWDVSVSVDHPIHVFPIDVTCFVMLTLAQAPGDMTGLFKMMIKRVNPSHLKRPKPFLQYILINAKFGGATMLSDLLFAQCNQDELSQCLETRLSESFITQLGHNANVLESQIMARCVGLVEVFKERMSELPSFLTLIDSKWKESGISALIAGRSATFIHRTAFDFVSDDHEGQSFIRSCSIEDGEAHLNLLRANVARQKFGLDRPLYTARSFPKPSSVGSLELVRCLEQHAECHHLDYHHLTTALQATLFDDGGLAQKLSIVDIYPLIGTLDLQFWTCGMPLGDSLCVAYACDRSLFSYLNFRMQDFSGEQQHQVLGLAWLHVATSESAGVAHKYLGFIAQSQVCDRLHPFSATSEIELCVRPRWKTYGLLVETHGPSWIILIAQLLQFHLNNVLAGSRNMQLIAEKVVRFVRGANVPLSMMFDLRLTNADGTLTVVPHELQDLPLSVIFDQRLIHDGGKLIVVRHELQDFSARIPSSLVIRCTLEGAIRLVLGKEALLECGIAPSGPLPRAILWCPKSFKCWLGLQVNQQIVDEGPCVSEGLFHWNNYNGVFDDCDPSMGYFNIDRKHLVQLLPDQLEGLSVVQQRFLTREFGEECPEGSFFWSTEDRWL